jgi:hypothetical protein
MVSRVGLKLQEVALGRAYAANPPDLRSGRSESSASQPRASWVKLSNPTRPARSSLRAGNNQMLRSDAITALHLRGIFVPRGSGVGILVTRHLRHPRHLRPP